MPRLRTTKGEGQVISYLSLERSAGHIEPGGRAGKYKRSAKQLAQGLKVTVDRCVLKHGGVYYLPGTQCSNCPPVQSQGLCIVDPGKAATPCSKG